MDSKTCIQMRLCYVTSLLSTSLKQLEIDCNNGHLGHCQCRTPLLFQNVQAYATIAVDVGMVYLCLKVDLQVIVQMHSGVALSRNCLRCHFEPFSPLEV